MNLQVKNHIADNQFYTINNERILLKTKTQYNLAMLKQVYIFASWVKSRICQIPYLMKNYFYHIRLFTLRFLLILFIFSISRVIFYLFNTNYFGILSFIDFLKIFIHGIRFDISALFYFNIIFIILSIVPGNFKNHSKYQFALKLIFILVNSLILSTNIIDTKFFDFENKRLTSDIFNSEWLGNDFITLLPQFIIDFWYLVLLWILFTGFLIWVYPRLKKDKLEITGFSFRLLSLQSVLFIIFLGIGVIGGRGGFQLKPLRVIHAAKFTDTKNVPLVLNTPFTIMKSIGVKKATIPDYFKQQVLDSIYSPIITVSKPDKEKPNIVIIILESFSSEYIGALNNGKGYTPFLDSLMSQSLVFNNAYANGKRSIEAMPSIIAGIPALTDGAYITSEYASNTINSVVSILKKQGYYTSFFHGGKNGTMGFSDFASLVTFDDYFGMDEYNNPVDYDGNWGIYDEEFLQFFKTEIDSSPQPFLTSVYTLTSHHPYKVPEKYKNRFPKGALNIHESIGYADFALREFFKSIKSSKWFKNTLFVITSDHTAQAETEYYNTKRGMYSIPIILYHPNDTLIKGVKNAVAQQIDIFPTIIDYVGCNDPFISFGTSLLNDTTTHFAINYISGIYQIIENNFILQFDGSKSIGFYNYKTDSLLKQNLLTNSNNYLFYENKLKAIIQSYYQRLNQNNMVLQDSLSSK